MPRGRPIDDLHQQLFDATTRILRRSGPAGISSRAITTEAGCAKGVLHHHFAGLEDFLVHYVRAVFGALHHQVSGFPDRAGSRTVSENLDDLLVLLHETPVAATHALLNADVRLQHRLLPAGSHQGPALDHVDAAIAAYLAAEQLLGRLDRSLDTGAAAVALTSTAHRNTLTTSPTGTDALPMARRVVALIVGETSAARQPVPGAAREAPPTMRP